MEILLHNHKTRVALIDNEDSWLVEPMTWTYWQVGGKEYAVSGTGLGRQGGLILMHRLIMNPNKDKQVDHIDGDGLNDHRNNLRICTATQQSYNKRPQHNKLYSNLKGVTWFTRDNRWKAQIMKAGKNYHLGYFDDEIEAAKAYDEAAQNLFGEFAKVNFP